MQFVKARARLVNNEFAEDLCAGATKSKERGKGPGVTGRYVQKSSTLMAGMQKTQQEKQDSKPVTVKCLFCSGTHRIWKCTAFMKLTYPDRRDLVSTVYSLFDPLGFIAPYVMKAKPPIANVGQKGRWMG